MENIPGTDRLGPGDMEMADIIGIEWNERLHNTAGWAGTNVGTHITHYFHFQQSREGESPRQVEWDRILSTYNRWGLHVWSSCCPQTKNKQKHVIFLLWLTKILNKYTFFHHIHPFQVEENSLFVSFWISAITPDLLSTHGASQVLSIAVLRPAHRGCPPVPSRD